MNAIKIDSPALELVNLLLVTSLMEVKADTKFAISRRGRVSGGVAGGDSAGGDSAGGYSAGGDSAGGDSAGGSALLTSDTSDFLCTFGSQGA